MGRAPAIVALSLLGIGTGSDRGLTPSARVTIVANARAIQPGELVVLTITTPDPADEVHVRAFDHDIVAYRLDTLRWRALVGIDLDVTTGTYISSIEAIAGSRRAVATHDFVVRAKHFPTRTLKVDPAFVTPPTEMEPRIVREAEELEALWHQSSVTRLWNGPFVRPVRASANSAFGSRSVFNGESRSPHGGADFPAATGTRIAAPNTGRVVLARDLYFSGNTVILDHGLGLFSTLAHLSVIDVHEGDMVSAGQAIGKVGATGRVTGPHLHWAVRLDNARVDPLAVLTLLGRQTP